MIDPPTQQAPLGFDVFDQADIWAGPDGIQHPIDHLGRHDRQAVLAWLRGNVRHFYLQALSRQAVSGTLRNDRRVPDFVFVSAEDWLESTALVKALTGAANHRVARIGKPRRRLSPPPWRGTGPGWARWRGR